VLQLACDDDDDDDDDGLARRGLGNSTHEVSRAMADELSKPK